MNYKKITVLAFHLMLVGCLSGCVSKGSINAVNQTGQQVHLDYKQVVFSNEGTLEIRMPSGEVFSGKFVQKSSSSDSSGIAFGGSSDDELLMISESSNTKSSLTEALLISSVGNTMKCQFQFSDLDYGIGGGGIGTCNNNLDDEINFTF